MLEHSEQFAEVAAALAKAQLVIENPTKNKTANVKTRTGSDYSYDYTDLAAVLDAVRKPFAENGIALLQPPVTKPNGVVEVQTLLVHTSGQWVACTLTATVTDAGPQGIGTAISYLRRYGLQSLAGLAAEDDDATKAQARQRPQGNRPPQSQQQAPRPAATNSRPIQAPQERQKTAGPVQPTLANEPPSEFIDDIQRRKLWKAATDIGWREAELKAFLKRRYDIDDTKKIPSAKFDAIVAAIQVGGDPPATGAAS